MANDLIQRFLFKDIGIRGQRIQLADAWRAMTCDRHYPPVISRLLGELSLMAIVLANGLKHKGRITLQIQGKGPVNLLVVEVTHDLKIKGVAKTSQTITHQETLDELLGDGQILATLENTQTQHHFQSYVSRDAQTIAGCFEGFFQQSEQIETRIWLAATPEFAGGLILQKMPDERIADEDAWNRILHLAQTVKNEELTDLDSEMLLHRLFHEETLELYEANSIDYHCPHDTSKIDAMLKSLGEQEVRKILAEQGEIVIHNEMCNFHARYDLAAVDALFADTSEDADRLQ